MVGARLKSQADEFVALRPFVFYNNITPLRRERAPGPEIRSKSETAKAFV
jgi:hypothetical protein